MEQNQIRICADSDVMKERCDVFLTRHIPSQSRSKIQKVIGDGYVSVNGKIADKNTHVSAGDIVTFCEDSVCPIENTALIPQDIPLSVLFEDDHLLAINKPAGMVVHPGNGNSDGTLVNALLYYSKNLSTGSESQRPGIVHRLDKDTSGVILIAKTDEIHRLLAAKFSLREVQKHYIGICVGKRPQEHAEINAPLGRSKREPLKRAVREDGKEALTEYSLYTYYCGISVVKFSPHTGRTHQIRVHASSKGFPVLCDPLYGGGKDAMERVAVLDKPFAYSVYKCFNRHALHAHAISFSHPVTQAFMTIEAPLPPDFVAALDKFKGLERKELLKVELL